jgi:hypothetical protein
VGAVLGVCVRVGVRVAYNLLFFTTIAAIYRRSTSASFAALVLGGHHGRCYLCPFVAFAVLMLSCGWLLVFKFVATFGMQHHTNAVAAFSIVGV